jgi:predicted nuclease of predicted toxin-antitoxin system
MRFLADESCDFRVIRALRVAGHDVAAVAEVAAGAEDGAIIEVAINEGRIFVTEDRDFGQLVYAAARRAQGVILLRFPSNARANLPNIVVDLVAEHGDKLAERFVVVEPGRIRFGAVPRH